MLIVHIIIIPEIQYINALHTASDKYIKTHTNLLTSVTKANNVYFIQLCHKYNTDKNLFMALIPK